MDSLSYPKTGIEDFGSSKREFGDSRPCSSPSSSCPHARVQHRRSKSASDRNLDPLANRTLNPRKDPNGTMVSPPPTWARRVRSPLRDPFGYVGKNSVSGHRASLEKDIEQLQSRLQQERSVRLMLEKAMGRASSTLSPGHRHVASKTKELIAEIELLEEEVENREQHILSLYRSIFEQSLSQPSSQRSSGVTSPAHGKHVHRSHPSIISSAFCSSKNFPLRHLRSLITSDCSEKRTPRKNYAPPLSGRNTEAHFQKPCPNPIKAQTTQRNSIVRTLKDHLYQCPSKLSEEMVRCMVAVYCWLRSTTSIDPAKSMVEISWISTDKRQFSRASYAINNYRMLVEQLEKVNVGQMEDNARTAFWINVYNSLVMHGYLAYGIPNGSLRRLALFHKAAYNIGGHIVSANAIEQSIFRFHTPRNGWWLETIMSTALRKRSGEERQVLTSKFGLPCIPPLICFALCTGAVSDPVLKVYSAQNLKEELESAMRDFLQANVAVKKSRVYLPRVIERFAKEASIKSDDLLSWVAENTNKKLSDVIIKCTDRRINRKKASQVIEWIPYCSRFHYVFSKNLAEKPWWV